MPVCQRKNLRRKVTCHCHRKVHAYLCVFRYPVSTLPTSMTPGLETVQTEAFEIESREEKSAQFSDAVMKRRIQEAHANLEKHIKFGYSMEVLLLEVRTTNYCSPEDFLHGTPEKRLANKIHNYQRGLKRAIDALLGYAANSPEVRETVAAAVGRFQLHLQDYEEIATKYNYPL